MTAPFEDNIGVKQGCVLSPTLFKLFINDLPNIFDSSCEPASLHSKEISCLLFADDVVLISESKDGLQRALNKIKEYSDKWALTINTEKSKIMIFNKAGKLCKSDLKLGDKYLENVNIYTYLGIDITTNVNFTHAINTLNSKAKKALFKIRNSIYQANLSPKISLQIYDTLVRPISTYCADTWGSFLKTADKMCKMKNNYKMFDDFCFEKTDMMFANLFFA